MIRCKNIYEIKLETGWNSFKIATSIITTTATAAAAAVVVIGEDRRNNRRGSKGNSNRIYRDEE